MKEITKDDYIASFKPKTIIHPNAFARYFNMDLKDAYKYFEQRVNTKHDIKSVIQMTCPKCYKDLPDRYYNINEFLTDNSGYKTCPFCDNKFKVDIETNNHIYYEKC